MNFGNTFQMKIPNLKDISETLNSFEIRQKPIQSVPQSVPSSGIKVYNINTQVEYAKVFICFYITFCIYFQVLIKVYKK